MPALALAALAAVVVSGHAEAQPSVWHAAVAPSRWAVVGNPGQLRGMVRVQPGENLLSVARRCGVSARALMRGNGLSPGSPLWPGRILWLPAEATSATTQPSDGALDPAAVGRTGLVDQTPATVGVAIADTSATETVGAPDVPGGQHDPESNSAWPVNGAPSHPASSPESAYGEYIVRPGDTLSTIAEQFGTTVAALQAWNGLTGDVIWAGQLLAVSADAPKAWSDVKPAMAGHILVDLSEQRMYVYAGNQLVWTFVVSTGMVGHPTRRGTFKVLDKIPNAWSTAWQLWMPYWLGIYWAGGSENGIHALPVANGQTLWGSLLGIPASYGCIVLDTADAARLYDWAAIGTPVTVRD